MYFIGQSNHRGTFFFYSKQHNGWIVADLDLREADLHNRLATVKIKKPDMTDVEDELENGVGLGQDGNKWLVDGEELVPLLREHSDSLEVLMVYYENGVEKPYGKLETQAADLVRKKKKEFDELL
jgi:hypothetical protein